MSEIRTHDEVIGIVGILAQEAYDDCDAGREQLGAQTNQAIEWLIATDAALRLALETATARAQSLSNELLDAIHARDNHRDRAATVSLMLDTIEGVATGQPGEIPTAVEDGWSTALGAVLALVRERDEWKAQAETDAAWARKTIEERDALLSRPAPLADAPPLPPGCTHDPSLVCLCCRVVIPMPAPPADAAREAVRYWTFQTEWGDGYRPAAVLFQTERIASLVREQNVRLELNVGPVIAVDVPLAALSSPAPAPSAPAMRKCEVRG